MSAIRLANEGGVIPKLMAHDAVALGSFWQQLGFTAEAAGPTDAVAAPDHADGPFTVTRDQAAITYVAAPGMDVRITQCVAFVKTDDVDGLHDEIVRTGLWRLDVAATDDRDEGFAQHLAGGAGIARIGAPVDREWGMRELRLFDPSNNLIRIAQDLPTGHGPADRR